MTTTQTITTGSPAYKIVVTGGSIADLPEWMRNNLLNEYRAIMQRARYIETALGLAKGGD